MDQDLITYLDQRFRETNQQIALNREAIAANREEIAANREAIASNQGQIASNREEITATNRRLDAFQEETRQSFKRVDQRFDEHGRRLDNIEVEARQTRVLLEGMSSDLKAVAEAVVTMDGKLDRYREECRADTEKVSSLLKVSFGHPDHRVCSLEERFGDHETRLALIEKQGFFLDERLANHETRIAAIESRGG